MTKINPGATLHLELEFFISISKGIEFDEEDLKYFIDHHVRVYFREIEERRKIDES